ncbi:hypothetical protein B0H11DRAFT_1972553 [Mycena galericulata]|nr:hypothetical protein B0H11DRAFT_1972553 [Mycena galericulata]
MSKQELTILSLGKPKSWRETAVPELTGKHLHASPGFHSMRLFFAPNVGFIERAVSLVSYQNGTSISSLQVVERCPSPHLRYAASVAHIAVSCLSSSSATGRHSSPPAPLASHICSQRSAAVDAGAYVSTSFHSASSSRPSARRSASAALHRGLCGAGPLLQACFWHWGRNEESKRRRNRVKSAKGAGRLWWRKETHRSAAVARERAAAAEHHCLSRARARDWIRAVRAVGVLTDEALAVRAHEAVERGAVDHHAVRVPVVKLKLSAEAEGVPGVRRARLDAAAQRRPPRARERGLGTGHLRERGVDARREPLHDVAEGEEDEAHEAAGAEVVQEVCDGREGEAEGRGRRMGGEAVERLLEVHEGAGDGERGGGEGGKEGRRVVREAREEEEDAAAARWFCGPEEEVLQSLRGALDRREDVVGFARPGGLLLALLLLLLLRLLVLQLLREDPVRGERP